MNRVKEVVNLFSYVYTNSSVVYTQKNGGNIDFFYSMKTNETLPAKSGRHRHPAT